MLLSMTIGMVILGGSCDWYARCVLAWHRLEARLADQRLRGILFLTLRQDLQDSQFIAPEGNMRLGTKALAILRRDSGQRLYYFLRDSGTDPKGSQALYRQEGVFNPVELIRNVVEVQAYYDCWDGNPPRLRRQLSLKEVSDWNKVVAFHLLLRLQADYHQGRHLPQNPHLEVISWARRT